jgi:hypothetical protein
MLPKRKYNTKDVDMLISTETIVDAAITHKDFLQSKRSNWSGNYFEDIKADINQSLLTHLGVDSAKALRQATQNIHALHQAAIQNLVEAKVQIGEDFKDDKVLRTEILNQLGFTTYMPTARKGNQEATVQLLYQFKANLTPELNNEIVRRGTAQSTLNDIITAAETFKNAELAQEGNKANRTVIGAEAIMKFNEIYEKVISISKMASRFYMDQPEIKAKFQFQKVTQKLGVSKTSKPILE